MERCSNLSTFKNLRNVKKIDIYNHSGNVFVCERELERERDIHSIN